jgi:acetyl esterase/lipase
MKRLLGIPYGNADDEARRLDVFLPEDNGHGACIFFIHGGGWFAGGRAQWHAVMDHFCARGYVCTSTSYHFAPQWHFPKQVEDVRLAMSFVKSRAGEYGIDTERIAVWGSSAGGHLAAMLATIGPEDELGMTPATAIRATRPNAAVCLCTVFSCHRYESHEEVPPMVESFLGATEAENPERFSQASPLDRVTGAEPPFLMVVGDIDRVTPVALHETMRDKLAAAGVPVELVVLPGVDHGYGYGAGTAAQLQTIAHAERFLAAHLPT